MNQTIFSVSELNTHIKQLLDGDVLLGSVAVRGELSNYKIYPSGHHYFTLKDAGSSIRCVMFRGNASRLRFRPENGMSVTVIGKVEAYLRDGVYQIISNRLIPEGVGDLQLAYEQLKEKLAKEGLFDPARKKPLPFMPRRIAVVTSAAGDAVRDIIRVTGARWPLSEIVVLPVRVQGAEAPAEIAGAIRYANRWRVGDLIITGRGGGSMEDLWAFNDERVARAIYESELPVISAVGHEPDVLISDFVADRRASTPTNAAELAVPEQSEVRAQLTGFAARLSQAMQHQLDHRREKLRELAGRKVLSSPDASLDIKRMELDHMTMQLMNAGERVLTARKQQFSRAAAALDAMSPLKVLARGYSVATRSDGKILTSVQDIYQGEIFSLRLKDGALRCRAEEGET